jgi:uncharacterized membrane protein
MRIDWPTLLTICGLAQVTYLTRIGGYWLVGRVTLSPRVESGLRALPGAVLVSLVAPTVLTTGVAEAIASVATVAVAARTRNLLAAMVVGVLVVWLARTFLRLS